MNWLKHTLMTMLSISIVLAGIPAQAASHLPCPMAEEMHMSQMPMQGMKDCKGCDKTAKHESKNAGCCGDAGCSAKCSVMNGGLSMNLPLTKTELAAYDREPTQVYPSQVIIVSSHLNTQERPPKSLA